jgi:hypothetical protein
MEGIGLVEVNTGKVETQVNRTYVIRRYETIEAEI